MICIEENIKGQIYVSNSTIEKTIKLNFKNSKNNIIIKHVKIKIKNSVDLFIQAEAEFKQENGTEINIEYLNNTITDIIKTVLIKYFKLIAKNISIIYDFKNNK